MKDGYTIKNYGHREAVLDESKLSFARAYLAAGGDHVVVGLVAVSIVALMVWCSGAVVMSSRPAVSAGPSGLAVPFGRSCGGDAWMQ